MVARLQVSEVAVDEVLLEFENRLQGSDGREYSARVCGRERDDHLWEGWVEFVGPDRTLRTGRETTQPNHRLLHYWATGLTAGYLDGALLRVLRAERPLSPAPAPVTGGIPAAAPAPRAAPAPPPPVANPPHAILDPFAVYAEGDQILRQQLDALSEAQLRNIIAAHGLAGTRPLDGLDRYELARHIAAEGRARTGR